MLKKFVVLIACLGVLQLTSCTSKDSKEDGGDEMAIDATDSMDSVDSAEVEKVEGEQSLDIAADDPAASSGADSLSTDSLPEDALGETAGMDAPPADPVIEETAPTDVAANESPVVEETLPPDTLGDIGSAETAPPVIEEPSAPVQEMASSTARETVVDDTPAAPKPVASYRKVEHSPWREGGKLVNSVYVARSGDSWSSVSQMIYGSEKVSELKKTNPSIKGRKLKVGDKVYYNSPHRPDDDTRVLTYYEDSGIAPEVYIAKSGDTVKTVAKELFGSDQNWKELYATNDFESKGNLDEGTQIKYWKSAPAAVAKTETAPAPPADMPPPADPGAMAANDMAPPPPPQADMMAPPPPDAAAPPADMAPPPPPADMAMNDMAPPPPPPPPVEAVAPPAPPSMDGHQAEGGEHNMEDDQMTTLAAGAVVAVGLALFMIMRRRRKKELEQAIQDTQVG